MDLLSMTGIRIDPRASFYINMKKLLKYAMNSTSVLNFIVVHS